MNRKEQYINKCLSILKERRKQLNDELEQLQTSLESETKSSAGDKYETSREMISQETNKLLAQFAEVEKQENLLSQIKTVAKHIQVQLGSIVETENTVYFISVSMGKVQHPRDDFMAISPVSPIGQLLLHKTEGEKIVWLKKTDKIKAIE